MSNPPNFTLDTLSRSPPPSLPHPAAELDARESRRRAAARRRAEKRVARLWTAETAEESMKRIEGAVEGWENVDNAEELEAILEKMKKLCGTAIAEKAGLVAILKEDVRSQDEEFEKETNDQRRDIEKHIAQSLQVQHAVHLHQLAAWQTLQDEFRDKLKEILEAAMSDVDEAQKEHADQQERLVRDRLGVHSKAVDDLAALEKRSAADYRVMKEKLEQRMHEMECDLSEAKLEYLLNSEIIEHNHVVLKKWIEESNMNLVASKRRLTKLNDVHNTLTTQLAETERLAEDELSGLAREVRAVVDQREATIRAVQKRREGYGKLLKETLENELREEKKLREELGLDQ